MNTLDAVFFDIGSTLGEFIPGTNVFQPFADSKSMLQTIRLELGLRIGIISTIGQSTNDEVWLILENVGLTDHIDRADFVSEHDAGVAKPNPEIYRFAANQFGLSTERCLFIGENIAEIVGAKMAGMQAMVRPRS